MNKLNLWRSFQNWNLDKKLILLYTLMILLPVLVITFLGFQRYSENMKQNTGEFSIELLNQLGKNLDNYLKELDRISISFALDTGVKDALKKNQEYTAVEKFNDKILIDKALMNIVLVPYKDVLGTYLFKADGEIFSRYGSGQQVDYSHFLEDPWYKKVLEAEGKGIFLPTYSLNGLDNQEHAFTFMRSVIDVVKNQSVGVFRMDINLDGLSDIFSNVLTGIQQQLFLVDAEGNIVYAQDSLKIAQAFPIALNEDHGSFLYSMEGKEMMINYISTQVAGWKIANIIPVSELTHNIDILRNLLWTLTGVALLLSIGLSILLTTRLLRPLKKMKALMNKVEDGDYTVQFKTQSNDEIGKLANSFNIMVKKINELVHHIFVIRILKREADFKVLQSQINPHFLYNTLESISMKAEVDQNYEVADMISRLGRLFRMTINHSRDLIVFAREMEYIDHYVILQKIRFPRMTFIIEIEPEVMSSYILPWIVQPLVENAIIHGLAQQATEGWIRIEGIRVDDDVYIRITDNGVGMADEKKRELQAALLTDAYQEEDEIHIGLKNIFDRIRLYFGKGYGLTLTSELGKGTSIEIKVKFLERESANHAEHNDH
ncbi:sensor histidine kinase [Paenibacillus psychroresistens]|nr:sensor histidine kinase [Paenibacillus psychroresistens]